MFCRFCGCEVPENSVFCMNCGGEIGKSVSPERGVVNESAPPIITLETKGAQPLSDNPTDSLVDANTNVNNIHSNSSRNAKVSPKTPSTKFKETEEVSQKKVGFRRTLKIVLPVFALILLAILVIFVFIYNNNSKLYGDWICVDPESSDFGESISFYRDKSVESSWWKGYNIIFTIADNKKIRFENKDGDALRYSYEISNGVLTLNTGEKRMCFIRTSALNPDSNYQIEIDTKEGEGPPLIASVDVYWIDEDGNVDHDLSWFNYEKNVKAGIVLIRINGIGSYEEITLSIKKDGKEHKITLDAQDDFPYSYSK